MTVGSADVSPFAFDDSYAAITPELLGTWRSPRGMAIPVANGHIGLPTINFLRGATAWIFYACAVSRVVA